MNEHVPFVYGQSDIKIAAAYYADSPFFRVAPSQASSLRAALPKAKLWLDARVDGLHNFSSGNDDDWRAEVKGFGDADHLAQAATTDTSIDKGKVSAFVEAAMARCQKESPEWVSIPQVPLHHKFNRNKLNKAMAKAARVWKEKEQASCKLMLPVILMHQDLVNRKTERNGSIKASRTNYEEAQADGVWIVESSMNDQMGADTYSTDRFPGLVSFHEEISEALNDGAVHVGGPYWGLNLVLWARGLIDYPAVGLGAGFQYYVPGQAPSKGKVRVVVEAIRRCAVVEGLKDWIPNALKAKGLPQTVSQSLSDLLDVIGKGLDKEPARKRTAKFYKQWIDTLAANHPDGRAVALYQDLSAAFVAGSKMPSLGDEEKPATREPAKVAKQLMMSCL